MYRNANRSRSHQCLNWIAATAAIVIAAMSSGHARAAVDPQQVDAAIDKAVAFLKSQQNKDGNWEIGTRPKMDGGNGPSEGAKWGGETAIATYALCAAGELQSENVKKAIEWLENADLHGTYAVGLRSQVWNFIPAAAQNKDRLFDPVLKQDVNFVLHSRIQHGAHKGFYGYGYGRDAGGLLGAAKFGILDPKGPPEGAWYDRSNSQYGVLGAWALEQAGAEIPQSYWKEEDEAWKHAQLTNGGWNYNTAGENSDASFTMTSAGIATLFITQDYMLREGHQFEACKGGVTNENIERGLAWMDKQITQALSGTGGGFYYYGLYGIERIGVASGRKYFGAVDWYQAGADAIVRGQSPSGSYGTIHDTCFALLFLVHGRAPVMMNKLIYGTASKKQLDPWNERPRDIANLAKWMGKHTLCNFLNWQLVDLKRPADELHDAPILYIAGSEDLSLSDQDIDKLRTFVEQGGMILGNADCGSRIFSVSFEKLGKKMFPKYEWDTLAKRHPIYSEQYLASKWKTHPIVRGMNNGIRELMVLIPEADAAKAWQIEATKIREESFQLAANIFLYATGKENLEHKGATYIVHADGEARRDIKVARLEIGDNWDPEPGAWRRLAAVMQNEQHLAIKPEPVKIAPGSLADYKIAALTGTTKVILTDDQRKELKSFIDNGGTLIIDAAGGSPAFADTVEAELTKMFGNAAVAGLAQPLPPETPALGDVKKTINGLYRHYCQNRVTGSLRDPRIRGINVNGRLAVFFSREDLTGALVGEPVDGVLGYEPAAATAMMASIVMAADSGKIPPAAVPQLARDKIVESERIKIQPALDALAKNPLDAGANLDAGKFYCFIAGDSDKGLPMLQRGSDPALKDLATKELLHPQDADAQFALAGGWWDLAGKQSGGYADAFREHSKTWYRKALPNLGGLAKTLAEKRLSPPNIQPSVPDESPKEKSPAPSGRAGTIDLLKLVDPSRDSVSGDWQLTADGLESPAGWAQRLRLPYHPPEEYDFSIEFTVLKGNQAIAQECAAAGHTFSWIVGGWGNTICGLDCMRVVLPNNPTAIRGRGFFNIGKRQQMRVQVRRDGVIAFLGNKEMARYKTNFSDVSMFHETSYGVGADVLGVVAFDNAVFHKIEVVEVSGPGRPIHRLNASQIGAASLDWPTPVGSAKSLVDLEPRGAQVGFDQLKKNQTVDGRPLFVDGKPCERFLFAHSPSSVIYDIPEGAMGFRAVGVSATGNKTMACVIYVDDNEALISKTMQDSGGQVAIALPLPKGAHRIELRFREMGTHNYAWSAWANPEFVFPEGAANERPVPDAPKPTSNNKAGSKGIFGN